MTTSLLQWKDAHKEDPPGDGVYLIVFNGRSELEKARWDSKYPRVPWNLFDHGCAKEFIEYWAALPAAEEVRKKFRDEEMKRDE